MYANINNTIFTIRIQTAECRSPNDEYTSQPAMKIKLSITQKLHQQLAGGDRSMLNIYHQFKNSSATFLHNQWILPRMENCLFLDWKIYYQPKKKKIQMVSKEVINNPIAVVKSFLDNIFLGLIGGQVVNQWSIIRLLPMNTKKCTYWHREVYVMWKTLYGTSKCLQNIKLWQVHTHKYSNLNLGYLKGLFLKFAN